MQLLEAIKERCSVRKYKDKSVKITDVLEILDAAKEAPSSGNLQNWRFVIVTDEEKRKEISVACLRQMWMLEAPVHVVVCNDPHEVIDEYEDRGKKYAVQNCAIVSQNIMLAALEHRLGSCFVAAFDDFAIKRILRIPDDIDVEAVITLGYADEDEHEKKYGLEILTFVNEFGNSKLPDKNIVKDVLKRLKK
ncbi:nitroreductase family protein [Candidatus Woesearchaeota archaeon]|nr:nitroreductase family protein [Candidatus Woesearchaeota archaeon]